MTCLRSVGNPCCPRKLQVLSQKVTAAMTLIQITTQELRRSADFNHHSVCESVNFHLSLVLPMRQRKRNGVVTRYQQVTLTLTGTELVVTAGVSPNIRPPFGWSKNEEPTPTNVSIEFEENPNIVHRSSTREGIRE